MIIREAARTFVLSNGSCWHEAVDPTFLFDVRSCDTSGFGKSKEAVARAILQRTVPEKYDNGEPQRFLMSWSDGTTMSSDKVDDIIRRIQKTPEVLDRLASATVLIDLYTTGLKLVTNTMRPFVRVRRVDNRPARRREIRPEA